MELVLAQPRGFCAGVVRAVDIVELALDVYKPPVYVFHEIVHNHHVVANLQQRGAVFVNDIAEIPEHAVVVFSAHGVSNAVVEQAAQRQLTIIDATCPLVAKVHLQCRSYAAKGYAVIMVGHLGHEEVDGTMGSFDGDKYVVSNAEDVQRLEAASDGKLAYVTQTTLSVDDTADVISALKGKYPRIEGPGLNDICYATQNRQNAVRELAKRVDALVVVGADNSSNSRRLQELGVQCGLPSYLVQDETEVRSQWFSADMSVGITAGASAPEDLVDRVVERLAELGASTSVHSIGGVIENTVFKMPQELVDAAAELEIRTRRA